MSEKNTEFRYQKDKYHKILAIEDMVIYNAYTGPEIACVIGFTAKSVRILKMTSLKHAQEYDIADLILNPKKGVTLSSSKVIKIPVDLM